MRMDPLLDPINCEMFHEDLLIVPVLLWYPTIFYCLVNKLDIHFRSLRIFESSYYENNVVHVKIHHKILLYIIWYKTWTHCWWYECWHIKCTDGSSNWWWHALQRDPWKIIVLFLIESICSRIFLVSARYFSDNSISACVCLCSVRNTLLK